MFGRTRFMFQKMMINLWAIDGFLPVPRQQLRQSRGVLPSLWSCILRPGPQARTWSRCRQLWGSLIFSLGPVRLSFLSWARLIRRSPLLGSIIFHKPLYNLHLHRNEKRKKKLLKSTWKRRIQRKVKKTKFTRETRVLCPSVDENYETPNGNMTEEKIS